MHEKEKNPHTNMRTNMKKKPIILSNIAKYIKPVIVLLARRDLLEKCIRGATQSTTTMSSGRLLARHILLQNPQ